MCAQRTACFVKAKSVQKLPPLDKVKLFIKGQMLFKSGNHKEMKTCFRGTNDQKKDGSSGYQHF